MTNEYCVPLRYGKKFGLKEKAFNAGVYGVNLDLWRKQRLHDEVLYWLDKVSLASFLGLPAVPFSLQQAQEPLWRFGTQPVMQLVVHGQWEQLDLLWNVDGKGSPLKETILLQVVFFAELGWNMNLHKRDLAAAKLLHWNGKSECP